MTQSPQPVGIPSKPRLGYSTLWTFLKIALALLLVGVVLSRTNLSELMALRQEIVLSWLLISFFLFFLMVFLKTLQYYVFLSSKIDLLETFASCRPSKCVDELRCHRAGHCFAPGNSQSRA
jgi:hypothetical protein